MIYLQTSLLIALLALLYERFFGYPNWLYTIIRHPVVWMGFLIRLMDRALNTEGSSDEHRRLMGTFALALLLFLTLLVSLSITLFLRAFSFGFLIEAVLASSMIAQKSLRTFVQAVADALKIGIAEAREAVRHIVGRDPAALDESDVTKAAIESLAENTADGVIAPLFWLALFGLPGAAVYKAINTADSMIGYRSDKYRAFGQASARLDDVVNYPASRLTGILFCLAAFTSQNAEGNEAWIAMNRDARRHVSPNAGWPEAAMAGALGVTLGGPRFYDGAEVDLATMGSGRTQLGPQDLTTALQLYARVLTLTAALATVATVVFFAL